MSAVCLYRYICQFVVTILLLTFWPTNGLSSVPYVNTFVSFMRSVGAELFSRTKEKDDEEDGEYEMVWDAEGSMHLVKKAVSRAPITNPESRTTGRCVLFRWCFRVLIRTEKLIVSVFLTERSLISMAEEMLLQGQQLGSTNWIMVHLFLLRWALKWRQKMEGSFLARANRK